MNYLASLGELHGINNSYVDALRRVRTKSRYTT